MRKLHIMSGLPASGKSMFCETKAKENGDIVIHRDVVRQQLRELLGSSDYFPCSAENEYAFYMAHIRAAAMASIKDIWIDQTTINNRALRKLLTALDSVIDLVEFEIVIEVMETPYEICCQRNAVREGFACVPDKTMKSMMRNFFISDDNVIYPVMSHFNVGRITVNRHYIERSEGFDMVP